MMTTLELHILQTLPPSRVNRGEDGQPKTAIMGGIPRNRISSQAMKATQRDSHRTARTKVPHELIARALNVDDEESLAVIRDVMSERYGTYDNRQRLKAMVYLDHDEVLAYAAQIGSQLHTWRVLRKALTKAPKNKSAQAAYSQAIAAGLKDYRPGMSPDLALFGRFVAEASDEAIVAATSYAHAISTHRDNTTADFFSAIDTVTGETAHIGILSHAAPTFYRTASLNVNQLSRNLGPAVNLAPIIRSWAHGYIHAIPTGGEHGAAAFTLPEYVLLIRREGGHALTLANAFTEPAFPSGEQSLLSASIHKLHQHLLFTETAYQNGDTTKALVTTSSLVYPAAVMSPSINAALDALQF